MQEREVSSNDLLDKLRVDYDELKSKYDGVVIESERLMSELNEYWAQYDQTCEELKRVKGTAEIELYHALEEERIKWERREAMLYTQLEEVCVGVLSGTSIGTLGMGAWLVSPTTETIAISGIPSPMVISLPIASLHIPEVSGNNIVSSSLRATAFAFTPTGVSAVTHSSDGASV